MSYCVNCGVRLEKNAKKCPLCDTPVYHPEKALTPDNVTSAFPDKKGQVETVSKKDMGIAVTVTLLTTAIVCGLINWLTFRKTYWSLAVIGICVIIWVILIPAVIYVRQKIYVSILYDMLAVALYLYMLTILLQKDGWFWKLGLPICGLTLAMIEIFLICIRHLPKSFLVTSLCTLTGIGLYCMGLEILIRRYLEWQIVLRWSAVVLIVCATLDALIITILSRRKLRNEVRRRLHF